MHPTRRALIVLAAAGLIVTGCGSDDDEEPKSEAKPGSAQVQTAEPKSEAKPGSAQVQTAEPKKQKQRGVRAQMVECIENELGFDVSPDGDDSNSLSVDDDGDKLQAVIVIHNDAGAAQKALAKTLGEDGLNAVAFGRAEFIRHAADDTESGVIANCVAAGYNRPS